MFINNYCTDFMFQEVMVCVTYSSSILSRIIHKFQQNEWYLERKKEEILRDNIVDYNVMHIMTRRIMHSML